MHNNYFFLNRLSGELNNRILGFTIAACFSQNKDELVIMLIKDNLEFWIQADLKRQFSCLSFPEQYSRARKNSINLFPEMIGRKISEIHQYNHERAFSFILDEEYVLLFKLFGNFSNILLYKDDQCINIFKHATGDENKIIIRTLDRQIDPLISGEVISTSHLKTRFPSFDKNILAYLSERGLEGPLADPMKHNLVNDTLAMLKHPIYYVCATGDNIKFSLIPGGAGCKKFTDPLEAINFFYTAYQSRFQLNKEKTLILRQLKTQLKKTKNYLQKSKEKLEALKKTGNYQQFGDIIMANLHNIRSGTEMAELFDFYNNKVVRIKLKRNLSPQKNAEQYYRKAKNQKIETQTLEKNLKSKVAQAEQISENIHNIEDLDNLKDLRAYAVKNKLVTKGKENKSAPPRFKIHEHMGFQILVGRNARNNDELTFSYGYKEDLWLHAKDVKGSHVLVKYQSGKNFPRPVITLAAQLAAFNSANKNMDTCAVIYTPRKFVRKAKGMPAGTVIVDKEAIILVKPRDL